MKKKEKLPKLAPDYMGALAVLAGRPEYTAFLKLCKIEENNIIIQSFKINSGDTIIAQKKAWQEGRMHELRKILKTFEQAKKGEEDGE